MKKVLLAFVFLGITFLSFAQIEGRWTTVGDKTGEAESIVEIYKKSDGLYYGRIAELLVEIPSDICTKCKDDRKNKKILGLEIIRGLRKEGDKWVDGRIVDPESGNVYKCKAEIDKDGNLSLRGFLGFSLLGRTQVWLKQ